jgi:prepilin-type N-terminal cleavage/methylation domain-containing protein
MKRHTLQRAARRGFTLVEMLVVVTLFLLLAGLTVAFLRNFRGSSASQGTTQLYGWLNQARQRAIRDRNPYGLRLVYDTKYDPTASGLAAQLDQLQYIEQPDDFYTPGVLYSDICPGGSNDALYVSKGFSPPVALGYTYVHFQTAPGSTSVPDFTGGFQGDKTLWPVQPGDYLEVNGSGRVHRIASTIFGDPFEGVNYNAKNAAAGNTLGLVLVSKPDLPVPLSGSWQYRIIRRPRVVGEDALRLPQGTVINLAQTNDGKNYNYSPPAVPPAGYDILFGPKGQVIGPAAAYDKIMFWIHETAGAPTENDPNLIVINTRAGSIAAYRVDTTVDATGKLIDPFSETRTGQTSPQ